MRRISLLALPTFPPTSCEPWAALQRLGEDSGIAFANETGGSRHLDGQKGRLRRLVASGKVPRIRFHDLRHTSATLMLANGEHPKIVQERLGHADIAMTMRYSHVTMRRQRGPAASRRRGGRGRVVVLT